jgi:hypothetical protein
MSRRARQRAQARPWDRLFDNSDADQLDVDALLAADGSDDHATAAHDQREREQQTQQRPA